MNPRLFAIALATSVVVQLLLALPAISQPSPKRIEAQPILGRRTAAVLTIHGLHFKDLNRNGKLDPYEDWRLSPEERAADLVQRLSLDDLAGLMVHGSLPAASGELAAIGRGEAYDLDKSREMIVARHINSFITRLGGAAQPFAEQNNRIQEIAESSGFGIPVTISSDPRHHFQEVIGANDRASMFSLWPEPLGFAAINDPAVTRQFGDVVRREYIAVGIRESLAPQADLATEPRWARANGTFGEDAQIASRMVEAYVSGIQNGAAGLNRESVIAVVKHWVGYGAVKDGWDSHNFYGRFASYQGDHFSYHIEPFQGAFDAHVAAIMPTYAILQGATVDGKPFEQVGVGFSNQLLRQLLRGKYGFHGVVLSDWAITNDCPVNCRNGAPAGSAPQPSDIGMPWGVEELTQEQRFAKAINAGVDQVGGTDRSDVIVEDAHNGSISEPRIREAATRILVQKFQLGLFEQPYVDGQRATDVAGNAEFVRAGEAAQAKAVVLLENKPLAQSGKSLLPIASTGKSVYLYGVGAAAARAAGFNVVTDPTHADFAIIRAPAPYKSEHMNYFFGSRQHEGRLHFTEEDAAYNELLRVSKTTPTVFLTTLERPLILTDVKTHATVLLGDFGISDGPLFALITGKVHPTGHLPFELPSSEEAVREQKSDLPHDSRNPLYKFGYGLTY